MQGSIGEHIRKVSGADRQQNSSNNNRYSSMRQANYGATASSTSRSHPSSATSRHPTNNNPPVLNLGSGTAPCSSNNLIPFEKASLTSLNGNSNDLTDFKANKLDTVSGVTLPTILNVLSILMFLRFGFIIGQMGILGTLLLLFMSYGIDLLTTLSISAIATNGTVKGGGAYYMISRSLGVEFGGAIGIIFYIGQVLNSALNVAGFIEPLMYNFNAVDGVIAKILPISYWHQFAYCTAFLALCTVVALIGSGTVSKAGTYLCIMLIISTLSIPFSVIFRKPFEDPELHTIYTGLSWSTFIENLYPNFTKGAAGSQLATVENFNDLFGIFFPATAGILAGASMSGDLKNPSKSIPKGTLDGLMVTFSCYFLVIISMGASIPRDFLYKDVQIIQTVNLSPIIILLGEMSTSIFSVIVGVVGASKLLQAIARDEILPGLRLFGVGNSVDDPIYGILFTWLLCQVFLFADINQIATLITMAFLMTFIVTNLACFLLKLGSAPNFRPSFKYFNSKSALVGTIFSGFAMFIVDGMSASLIFIMLLFLIIFIHYVSPPKQWGDVSQSLIYHQVRKYLLKLKQDNVKYWRPQVLLLVDNPRTSFKLISFCNHLKKGGLYVLGHVMVSQTFQNRLGDLNKNRKAWLELRDLAKIKAFIQISMAPSFVWGVRNVFLGSGLGGMKPNLTIIGFYDLSVYISKLPYGVKFENATADYNRQVSHKLSNLPTDSMKTESKLKLTEWVQVLEDLSLLDSNIAVAKGFPRLHIPNDAENALSFDQKKYIDLYPIQMASKVVNQAGDKNILTTNFDTYTLILQLGAILNTVPSWKKTHRLRVVVFVEFENDIEEERERLKSLLDILRIEATIVVLCLTTGNYKSYNYLLKGEQIHDPGTVKKIERILVHDEWWQTLKDFRKEDKDSSSGIPIPLPPSGRVHINSHAVHKISKSSKRKYAAGKLTKLGVSLSMVANKISRHDIKRTFFDNLSDDEAYSASDAESISSISSSSTISSPLLKPVNPSSAPGDQYQGSSSSAHQLRRPLLKTLKSTTSIRRGKSSLGFSADTIPNSQVFENAQGNEPSVGFVHDDTRSQISKNIDDITSPTRDQFKDGASLFAVSSKTSLLQPASLVPPPLSPGHQPQLQSFFETETSYDNLVFTFNEASDKSQFLILNELMTKMSKDTALIFSTLPIPDVGLHKSEEDCLEYVMDLNIWCDGLPPILLINSKTMTVTTNL